MAAIAKRHAIKERILQALTRLSDRDTFLPAVNELGAIIATLDAEGAAVMISCLSQNTIEPKASSRREMVLAFMKLGSSRCPARDAVLSPQLLSKVLTHLKTRMRDADSSVREAAVEVVGSLAASMKESGSPHGSPDQGNPLIKFLVTCLLDGGDARVLDSCCRALGLVASAVGGLDTATIRLMVKLAINPTFTAREALMHALGHWNDRAGAPEGVVATAGGVLLPYLGVLLTGSAVGPAPGSNPNTPASPSQGSLFLDLRREDWLIRKAAVECVRCIAFVLGPALDVSHAHLSPEDPSRLSARTAAAVEPLRFDKTKPVREQAQEAGAILADLKEFTVSGITPAAWPSFAATRAQARRALRPRSPESPRRHIGGGTGDGRTTPQRSITPRRQAAAAAAAADQAASARNQGPARVRSAASGPAVDKTRVRKEFLDAHTGSGPIDMVGRADSGMGATMAPLSSPAAQVPQASSSRPGSGRGGSRGPGPEIDLGLAAGGGGGGGRGGDGFEATLSPRFRPSGGVGSQANSRRPSQGGPDLFSAANAAAASGAGGRAAPDSRPSTSHASPAGPHLGPPPATPQLVPSPGDAAEALRLEVEKVVDLLERHSADPALRWAIASLGGSAARAVQAMQSRVDSLEAQLRAAQGGQGGGYGSPGPAGRSPGSIDLRPPLGSSLGLGGQTPALLPPGPPAAAPLPHVLPSVSPADCEAMFSGAEHMGPALLDRMAEAGPLLHCMGAGLRSEVLRGAFMVMHEPGGVPVVLPWLEQLADLCSAPQAGGAAPPGPPIHVPLDLKYHVMAALQAAVDGSAAASVELRRDDHERLLAAMDRLAVAWRFRDTSRILQGAGNPAAAAQDPIASLSFMRFDAGAGSLAG